MKKINFIIVYFHCFYKIIDAQVVDTSFKANIFKYSKDAQPFSLAFGAAGGTGSLGATAGFCC